MQRTSRSRSIDLAAIGSAAFGWALSTVTTAALVAIGWYGHETHWTFGLAGHHDAHAPAGGHGTADEHVSAQGHPATPSSDSASRPSVAEGATAATIRFGSKEALDRTGIELVPVEERLLVNEIVSNGVVRYDERRIAQLSARVPGTVWRVEKHLGDRVRQGEVLLIVESREVGRLKAEFLNCLVAHETRQKQLEILEEVKGAVLGRQIREARSALREARNHLINAEQALVNLGFDVKIAEYEPLGDDERADAIRTVGVRQSLSSDETRQATSNLLPLRAPFDGIVIGRDVVVGEVVEPATPIFEVADVSNMWVVLNVNKEDAGRVVIGQPVRFRPDGSNEECISRVSWISTEVDPQTRTLEVRAELVNAPSCAPADATDVADDGDAAAPADRGERLRANTFGVGRIEVGRRGTALVVPNESLQWDGSRWIVFVPAGDMAFEPLAVSPGLRDGDDVEIVGDLAGRSLTHVVGAGSHVLKSKILLDRIEAGEL